MPDGVVHSVPQMALTLGVSWSGRSGAPAGAHADLPKNSQQKQSSLVDGVVKL
jgi:hypothetical protein